MKPFGTKNCEDRSGVGATHHAGKQETGSEAEVERLNGEEIESDLDEETGYDGSEHDAESCKRDALPQDRANVIDFRVHSAGEKNDAERDSGDCTGDIEIFEFESEPIAATSHADAQEEEKNRHTEPIPRLASKDAQEEEERGHEQEQFYGHRQKEILRKAKIVKIEEKIKKSPVDCEPTGLIRLIIKDVGVRNYSSLLSTRCISNWAPPSLTRRR